MMRPSEDFVRAEIAYRESLFGPTHTDGFRARSARRHLRNLLRRSDPTPPAGDASAATEVTGAPPGEAAVIGDLGGEARRPSAAA